MELLQWLLHEQYIHQVIITNIKRNNDEKKTRLLHFGDRQFTRPMVTERFEGQLGRQKTI